MKPNGGAVIYAKDFKRLARFYECVGGMHVAHRAANYVVLDAGAFQLVVLRIPARIAGRITITVPPARREDTPIKPVFFVESITRAREVAAECGGSLNAARREWAFGGFAVCDGCDPEGNIFQLRQVAKRTKR